jgi:protein-L-isoaspartate O-methyltransferase
MLDLAAVAQGSRVLDVGCGSGEQTVIAAPMVAATEKNAAAAGLRNVSTRVCPADALSADQLTRAKRIIVGLQRQAMTHAKGENANVGAGSARDQTGSRA